MNKSVKHCRALGSDSFFSAVRGSGAATYLKVYVTIWSWVTRRSVYLECLISWFGRRWELGALLEWVLMTRAQVLIWEQQFGVTVPSWFKTAEGVKYSTHKQTSALESCSYLLMYTGSPRCSWPDRVWSELLGWPPLASQPEWGWTWLYGKQRKFIIIFANIYA